MTWRARPCSLQNPTYRAFTKFEKNAKKLPISYIGLLQTLESALGSTVHNTRVNLPCKAFYEKAKLTSERKHRQVILERSRCLDASGYHYFRLRVVTVLRLCPNLGYLLISWPLLWRPHFWRRNYILKWVFLFNSRTAIAGAIIGLLLVFFYFVVMIFVTTIWRHSHFLFIRSCNFNWIACVT